MQFSSKTRYSLRALIQLVLHSNKKPMFLKEIAKLEDLPIKYLETLFNTLKKNGILISIRGANGGYMLAKKPEEISLLNILEIFEGELNLVECLHEDFSCKREKKCTMNNIYSELNQQIKSILDVYNLKTISEVHQKNNKNTMYYI